MLLALLATVAGMSVPIMVEVAMEQAGVSTTKMVLLGGKLQFAQAAVIAKVVASAVANWVMTAFYY